MGRGYYEWDFDEILTDTQVNELLMSQTIPRFADAGSRNSAITSPDNNQYSYVDGTGLTRWNGTTWVVEIAATAATVNRINFPTIFSHWTWYGTYQRPSYYKDFSGVVHVDGMLRAGSPSPLGDYVVVLPSGYRPALPLIFPVMLRYGGTEGVGRVTVATNGQVEITSALGDLSGNFTNSTDWLSLSGISFLAGA